MQLSDQQQLAVTRSGQDACCAAGPGSGKTSVLVERFAWLVDQGREPQRILAITFTEKAANNIKSRLVTRFEASVRDGLLAAVQRAPVSTIHGFCSGVLREYALDAALDPAFRVMDELETSVVRWTTLDAVLNRFAVDWPGALRTLYEMWPAFDPAGALLAVHDAIRNDGGIAALRPPQTADTVALIVRMKVRARDALAVCPDKSDTQRRRRDALNSWLESESRMEALAWVMSFDIDLKGTKRTDPVNEAVTAAREVREAAIAALAIESNLAQHATLRDILTAFDAEYAKAKRELATVDFTDLEEKTLALLTSNRFVREEVSSRYEAVLMDEVQDTNELQWSIVNAIRREERFFAVGDLNQSIYGFRHARPQLFEAFQNDFVASGRVVDRLETNYRSRPEIIDAVNAVSATRQGITAHTLQPRPGDFTPKAQPSIEVQACLKGAGGDSYESEWLVRRVVELKTELDIRWSDIAVLSRSAPPLAAMEAALMASGIPCVLAGGGNFFDRQEVIDLMNWLRVLDSPRDEIALYGLLRSPFFGHTDEEMFALRVKEAWPPAESMAMIDSLRVKRDDRSVAAQLALMLDECGYTRALDEPSRANVDKLLNLVRAYELRMPGDIASWVREMDTMRETSREANAPVTAMDDAVQLLTIHKAKGLEFKAVAIVGAHRATPGDRDPISWTRENGLGVAWLLPGQTKATPDPTHIANREQGKSNSALEEDRLLYVAMTRAEQHLLFSLELNEDWKSLPAPAKRFIEPLGLDLALERHAPSVQDGVRVVIREGEPDRFTVAVQSAAVEVPEIERLDEAPQPSPAISVTALANFFDCPRRALLDRILNWPVTAALTTDHSPRTPVLSPGLARGTALHALLAGEEVDSRDETLAELIEIKQRFERSDLGCRAAQSKNVHREFDFLFELNGTLLRGAIDLWFEDANGDIIIVDYKTGRHLSPERLAAYEAQIRFYALALERLLGRMPARGCLAMLDRDDVIDIPLGDSARAQAAELFERFAGAETRGEFEMRPGGRCDYCPFFKGSCESPWRTAGTSS